MPSSSRSVTAGGQPADLRRDRGHLRWRARHLGLWASDGGEGAKFWLAVLTEIKNRGTTDVCMVVCDGLKGLSEAVGAVWERAIVQTCVIHLLRNTFRYASRKYWDQIAKDIRPVYTAATEAAAKERFVEFTDKWGAQYPAIIRLWENAWSEFVPFLDYDVEIRRVICSTNAIESIKPATVAPSAPVAISPLNRPP